MALEEGDLSDLPDWMADDLAAAREVLSFFGEIPDEGSKPSPARGQLSVAQPLAVPGSIEADLSRGEAREATGEEPAQDINGNTAIGANAPNRYVPIEQIPSGDAFQFMSDFADEVAYWRIRSVLHGTLRGKHPFRRFKDAISSFPEEREPWFAYESIRRRDYIKEWARDAGIEIDFSSDVS